MKLLLESSVGAHIVITMAVPVVMLDAKRAGTKGLGDLNSAFVGAILGTTAGVVLDFVSVAGGESVGWCVTKCVGAWVCTGVGEVELH